MDISIYGSGEVSYTASCVCKPEPDDDCDCDKGKEKKWPLSNTVPVSMSGSFITIMGRHDFDHKLYPTVQPRVDDIVMYYFDCRLCCCFSCFEIWKIVFQDNYKG